MTVPPPPLPGPSAGHRPDTTARGEPRPGHRLGTRLVGVLFVALGLNALVQVPNDLYGWSDTPSVLSLFQAAIAICGLAAGLGAWRSRGWAWRPALGYALVTSLMIVLLGPILDLDADARRSLPLGAGLVLVVCGGLAWYLRRALAAALLVTVSAAGLLGALGPARAAAQAPITAAEIDGHIRFLSSDLLEGRAPATRGGALTEEYLAAQLRGAGVAPAVQGSFFQRVPIDVVTMARGSLRAEAHVTRRGARAAPAAAPRALRFPDDVVLWAGSSTAESAANAPVVFVGHGVTAPEFRWDDFKDVDVRGKLLLILVNDPPAPADEPALFGGRAMTYYGRWTYKFEEAERRGAAGALIVHDTERAGYGWATVVGSWAREQRMLPRDPRLPAPLAVRGWITGDAARALLAAAGHDLDALQRTAASRRFRPVETGISLDIAFRSEVARLEGRNVIGVVEGSDPDAKREHVLLTAHWDHLGIGTPVDGDSIYNGAEDNASGTANLLAIARQLAQGPRLRRSVLIAFVTAEESGLLGSEYLAQNPVVPTAALVANLNVDGGNVLGETRDLIVLGDTKSSLGPSLARLIAPRGMRLSPDATPERGLFYRSDHFSAAKAGVPAVSINAGEDFTGRPAGWGAQQGEAYTRRRYHQPADEYDPAWDLRGAVQLSGIVLEFTRWLADSREWPTWNADAEFRRSSKQPAM